MFVLLKTLSYKVVDVITVIEDIRVKQTSRRCFYISVIIFACPEIEERKGCSEYVDFYRDCKDGYDCKDYINNNEDLELFLDEDEKDYGDLADYSEAFHSKTNSDDESPIQKVNRTKKNSPHRKYSLKRKKVKYYKSR